MADFRVLITGSRDWADRNTIWWALKRICDEHQPRNIVIVHGAARGADTLAAEYGAAYGIRTEPHPARWNQHGKAAGFRRNAEMVTLGASVCLAFIGECRDPKCRRQPPERHGSHGASQCSDLAEKAGIEVRRFEPWRSLEKT